MSRPLLLLAPALALLASSPVLARADEPAAPRDASGTTALAPRIRATHRVDVIAPGEKVETVVDRMRAQSAAAARQAAPTEKAPMPAERRGERGPDGGRMMGGPGAAMGGPGPGGAPMGGGMMQGGMGGMGPGGTAGPGPRGDAPPPDRPRHR